MTHSRANFRLCKKAVPSEAVSSEKADSARRRQRGVFHILFLIFAILGVSLWGISEFLLTAEKEARQITADSAAVVTDTKRILLNYTLNFPPPNISEVYDCGLQDAQGCYNYYESLDDGMTLRAKANYLRLPCPGLATDGKLDGASDILGGCGTIDPPAEPLGAAGVTLGITLGARFGRLPWRDERENQLLVRGFGNRDMRDGSGGRLWYGLSRNIVPCVVSDPNSDRCDFNPEYPGEATDPEAFLNPEDALNCHALSSIQTGWLNVVGQDDDGNQVLLSDRVAAVVIAPGSAGGTQSRPDEDLIYSGSGASPLIGGAVTLVRPENYLEHPENIDGDDTYFASGGFGISIQVGFAADRTDPDDDNPRHAEDHLEYITIDEICNEFAVSGNGERIVDLAAELLDGYYRRLGHYPDPAAFIQAHGENKSRPPGNPQTDPAQVGGEAVLLRRAAGVDGLADVEIQIADLPPVYLAAGWRFPEGSGNFDNEPAFPFSESLLKMKTRLADSSLQGFAGGFDYGRFYRFDQVLPSEIYGQNALAFSAVAAANPPAFDFAVRARQMTAEPGVTVRVALAAPMALNSTATVLADFPGDAGTAPVGGADIILPVGTELELVVGEDTAVRFPPGLQIRGQPYRTQSPAAVRTREEILRDFPDLSIPLVVRNPVVAHRRVSDAGGDLLLDANGKLMGVGTDDGRLRPVASNGSVSRYELRPVFEMSGPVITRMDPAYGGPGGPIGNYENRTGRLSDSDLNNHPAIFQTQHAVLLATVQIRDFGSPSGRAGIPPEFLVADVSFVNPRAFQFFGNDINDWRGSGFDDQMNNAHLSNLFTDPEFTVMTGLPDVTQTGSPGQTNGRPHWAFNRWPFIHVIQYDNNGQIPECNPTCPYSAGFTADRMSIVLDVDAAAFNAAQGLVETSGVELVEPTLLPARIVGGGGGTGTPARVVPSRSEAVSGRMGFAPSNRAGAALDSRHFSVHDLRVLSFANPANPAGPKLGNAAAHLYFSLTTAARNRLQMLPFPPPGRPAIRGLFGAPQVLEESLVQLPTPVGVPPGAAVGMPAGTRIIFSGAAAVTLGRNFQFPDGAVALLPPGAEVLASLRLGDFRPNGTEVRSGELSDGPLELVELPQGGILELGGSRVFAGGGRFDEMAELEIRGAAVGTAADGGAVMLGDGAVVQPFTGRAISPVRTAIPDGAEIEGAARVRGRFVRRPHSAPRTAEPDEPVYPLEIDGAPAAAQRFAPGTFLREDTLADAGALELTFDEDTEFTLPAEFTLTVDAAMWAGAGDYRAVETGGAPELYELADSADRASGPLTLTVPAGTRIYDKQFPDAAGGAVIAAADFEVPLAADLGGPEKGGLARFHFALFPESDLIMRDPAGGAAAMVIPGGGVADLSGQLIHPPAGAMRIPRVAGDLELVSNGAMMIFVGPDSGLEYEYAEVARPGDAPHGPTDQASVPYYRYDSGGAAFADDIEGALGETSADPRNAGMEIPEGAIIMIPPGDPLPLHANYALTVAAAESQIRLPQNAVLVLRDDQMEARFAGGGGIAGPGFLRLGGAATNGRAVGANLILAADANVPTSGESFVMLTAPARLRARPGTRVDAPLSRIPAGARLDLYGNLEARADGWFFDEMIPSEAAEALKNFPMAYAVAPECRRAAAETDSCEGGDFRGLTFEIPAGEEVALPEDLAAPDIFRIESGDGSSFDATLFVLDNAASPQGARVEYLRVGDRGKIFTGNNNPAESNFRGGSFDFNADDRGRKYVVAYPPASGLRVYLGLGAPPADAADLAAERAGVNYVEVRRPLTVYNGGYVGGVSPEAAQDLAVVQIDTDADFVLGAGSRPFDGGARPGAFGPGSRARVRFGESVGAPTAEVDLRDYTAINNGQTSSDFFTYNVSLGAQMALVDSLGRVGTRHETGEFLEMAPGPADAFRQTRAYQSRADVVQPLRLAVGQTLEMEPGYLWQGFIPAGGVRLEFTQNEDLHQAYWPPSPESPEEALMQRRIHLRVHPSDLALNFFGSGLETVEGLDGEAAQVRARELLAISEALFLDFAQPDYGGADRRLTGYRVTVNSAEDELLAGLYPPDAAPYQIDLAPSPEAGRSHGVNPNILHLPGSRRLSLITHHALRVNVDPFNATRSGVYEPAGSLGNARALTHNGIDPLFFANWILHGGVPVPGLETGEHTRHLTVLPADGLKVRRVRLGIDPLGARLNRDLPTLRIKGALTGTACGPGEEMRFSQGPVPPYAARTNYPGSPCPPHGRADQVAGYDALFPLRVSLDNNTGAELAADERYYLNPPMLAVVRDTATGRALTVTTFWHNYYGYDGSGGVTLGGRMVWGANKLPFIGADKTHLDGAAPAHFQHILPSVAIDSPEFLHDQDWDWFASSGLQAADLTGLRSPAGVGGVENPEEHAGILSGPFSNRHPDAMENVRASGLDMSALGGMCAVDSDDKYLEARFAPPPIQLAALDISPGLAWPRPGREKGTADLDKRIRGAFVADARRLDLAERLSPFAHAARDADGVTLTVFADAHERPKLQNRILRGLAAGKYEVVRAGGEEYIAKVPPEHIPRDRAPGAFTADPRDYASFLGTTPPTTREITTAVVTRAYSELYVYMDRPHDPRYMGGEKRKLVVGPDFRVEGPAALVPPFAASSDRAMADVITQRSRMMSDLFGVQPLGDIYAADFAGADECGGMDPCPAMWTRSDWAPVLGGVVAMEAVNMEMSEIVNPSVLDNVYFVLPQPEMEVMLEGGTVATLLAGSIIYPFLGRAIPAEKIGADAEIVIRDRAAVAAVDVSPAVAPTPVRIFREKTHQTRVNPQGASRVDSVAEFNAEIRVENRLGENGRLIVSSETCPAFVQAIPAPQGAGAFSGLDPAAAFSLDDQEFEHALAGNTASGLPADEMDDRYPDIKVTMTTDISAPLAGYENARFTMFFGDEIAEVTGIRARLVSGNNFVSDHDGLQGGIAVVSFDRDTPAAGTNRLVVDFGQSSRLNGSPFQPFLMSELAGARADVRLLRGDDPESIFVLEAGLRRDLCADVEPVGFLTDLSAIPVIEGTIAVDAVLPGQSSPIPEPGDPTPVLQVFVSSPTVKRDVETVYNHDSGGWLGFNDETYADMRARGPVPRDIDDTHALWAGLRAACPECIFQENVSGLIVRAGSRSTILTRELKTRESVIQSYDFTMAIPAEGTPRQLSDYQTFAGGPGGLNAVNAYYTGTECPMQASRQNTAGDAPSCRFLAGEIVRASLRSEVHPDGGTFGVYGYTVTYDDQQAGLNDFMLQNVVARVEPGGTVIVHPGYGPDGRRVSLEVHESNNGLPPLIEDGYDGDGCRTDGGGAHQSRQVDGVDLNPSCAANTMGFGLALDIVFQHYEIVRRSGRVETSGGLAANIDLEVILAVIDSIDDQPALYPSRPGGSPVRDRSGPLVVPLVDGRGTLAFTRNVPIKQAVIRNERFNFVDREEYDGLDAASSGIPAGAVEGDLFRRLEIPLDVSPLVNEGGERRARWAARVLGSEFSFAPIQAMVRDSAAGTAAPSQCVVEPLGFLPLYAVEYDDPSTPFLGGGLTVTSLVAPAANLRWHEPDSEARGYYPSRFEVIGGNVNEVRRYDGGFTRGFLATPHVAEALAAYYAGDDAWRGENPLPSSRNFVNPDHRFNNIYTARRMGGGALNLVPADGPGETAQVREGYSINRGAGLPPSANQHIRLRNPLAHLWQNRHPDAVHSELMGGRRLDASRARLLARQKICGSDLAAPDINDPLRENIPQRWCLDFRARTEDTNAPFAGVDTFQRFGYFGVAGYQDQAMKPEEFRSERVRTPFVPSGVRLLPHSDPNPRQVGPRPIRALRLPHAIQIPMNARLKIRAGGLGYPSEAGRFFEFPPNSRAQMMNIDLSSWESIHPALAATRGGMSYRHAAAAPDARGTVALTPPPLSRLDEAPGEAFSEFDIGGRRFLHYHRSESAPAEEPTSGRQIHANAWIRLEAPGALESAGARTELGEGTILNPVAGTYVRAPAAGRRGDPDARLPYPSRASAGVGGSPLRLVRPALILPKGAKLVLQARPARMTRVRAAVFFSPAPLESASCPSGPGGAPESVDQARRGGTLGDGTAFTLGHPCAWLDHPENLDGDRNFVYTNRPRWNASNTRMISNDRVVLMGGRLEL